ncbi:hypothetical protein ABZ799_01135 [Nocardiopsis dassonvillei]|uniref:hypothetical protein n=1 Tax=Nocardiopsis dassonvillei TaxID=2014 RepID=UPI0034076965
MSLYPIVWALEHAPVIDAAERAVLMALANKGDFDGCNAYRGYPALARVAKVDTKTVRRKCHAMEERGILRRQTGKMPEGWLKLPADKKTVVWEIMIPHSHYSPQQLANLNESRAERGRGPITPENRPDLPEAPAKPGRKDKGQERPERRKKKDSDPAERGDTKSPGTEGTTSPPATGHEVPSRGDSESPNPLMGPSDVPSSSSVAEVEDITEAAAPSETKKKSSDREEAERIISERLPDTTPDERSAIIDVILAEAAAKGRKIGFLATYTRRRPDVLLEQDLSQVRRHSAAPTVTECGIHGSEMKPYGCDACAGEIKAGDPDDIARLRAHLAAVGVAARPDLARLLGAPQSPTGNVRSIDEGERIRRMQRRPSGAVGGSRNPVADHAFYSQHTDDELKARFLG